MTRAITKSFDLTNRRVWVTGASRGLGKAIATALLDAGARVAVTARTERDLKHIASEAAVRDDQCLVMPGSVDDASQLSAITDQIAAAWGGLDAIVNCAGVSPSMTPSAHVAQAAWQEIIDVNLTGLFACCREGYRLLSAGGSVVNISSIHGSVGMPRLAAYSASKGAIHALSRTLALEWARDGIRVNTVSPGYFETDLTKGLREHPVHGQALLDRVPLGRFGKADEIVPLIVYLVSSASAYVTGADFVIDGGWSAQ